MRDKTSDDQDLFSQKKKKDSKLGSAQKELVGKADGGVVSPSASLSRPTPT